MTLTRESAPSSRRRAVRDILLYGAAGGLLIAVLKLTEYRFLVVEHSVEIYGALVAALFAGLGIWLGQTLTRKKPAAIIKEVPAQDPIQPSIQPPIQPSIQPPVQPMGLFVADQTRVSQFGITPREMEMLGLIATGLSNREIAGRLFVSENTVKTHLRSVYYKLGVSSRREAVERGVRLQIP